MYLKNRVSKLPFTNKPERKDTKTAIYFLTTWFRGQDKDNRKKIKHMIP